jgi:hypothetical protein
VVVLARWMPRRDKVLGAIMSQPRRISHPP